MTVEEIIKDLQQYPKHFQVDMSCETKAPFGRAFSTAYGTQPGGPEVVTILGENAELNEDNDLWQPIEMAPKGLIQRWHKIHECPVAVERNNGRVPSALEWIVGTLDHSWPEDAFTPHWKPLPLPPEGDKSNG